MMVPLHSPPPAFASVFKPLAGSLVLLWAAGSPVPAHAYRPFDGTDAAVVAPGEFELEAGAARQREGASRSLSLPAAVANIGIAGDSEIVIEGRWMRLQEPGPGAAARNLLGDTALSIKHVWRKGVLQDAEGPSIATECGVLLPEVHGDPGTGYSCAGIASSRIDPLTLHVNLALGRTRRGTQARDLGLITEGPEMRAVRPVAEVLFDRDSDGGRSHSILLGAIYRCREDVAFDAGVRSGRSRDAHLNELRIGFTWSVPAR